MRLYEDSFVGHYFTLLIGNPNLLTRNSSLESTDYHNYYLFIQFRVQVRNYFVSCLS